LLGIRGALLRLNPEPEVRTLAHPERERWRWQVLAALQKTVCLSRCFLFFSRKRKTRPSNAQTESKDSEEDKKEKADLARFASDLEEGQAVGGRFTRSG
jgi:hypothetical protein